MIGRCASLLWRYNSASGPVPPKALMPAAATSASGSALPSGDDSASQLGVTDVSVGSADEGISNSSCANSRHVEQPRVRQ